MQHKNREAEKSKRDKREHENKKNENLFFNIIFLLQTSQLQST